MKIIKILLVEDDYLDIIDIRRNLDKMKLQYNLQIARNRKREYFNVNNGFDLILYRYQKPL